MWKNYLQGFKFYEGKLQGLHEKHKIATWKTGTISAFVLRQRKIKKT